jgi:hypothetical protein
VWQSNSRKGFSGNQVHGVNLRQARNFHLKRVECRLTSLEPQSAATTLSGRLLLNDITQQGMAVYSPELLSLGKVVTIEFEYPEMITLKAKVGWCQQLSGIGKVITARAQSFRIGMLFEHEKPEDQEKLKAFCDRLAEIYPGIDLTRAPYAA